jgi:hypothetical protein
LQGVHIEDRRGWDFLGYGPNGDAYSLDRKGDVWVQPFEPVHDHADWEPPEKSRLQESDLPDLHTDEPTVDETGHAKFGCNTCLVLKKNRKKKRK